MTISIDGLTPRQVELLDAMWTMETLEEVWEWMSDLSAGDRMDAQSLQLIATYEVLEIELEKGRCREEAQEVVDRASR